MSAPPFLTLAAIGAGYGGLKVIEGINIAVAKREIVVVIGPNGAGKSTVLKSVFGLTKISEGEISFEGTPITGLATNALVPLGIAAVPQVKNVFPNLTVLENLEIGTYAATKGDNSARRERVLTLFPDLGTKLRQPAGELSGGQRQMVAIGRALMSEPRLLLLDEPTAGLSPAYMEIIFDLVLSVREAGVTILMVEQNARQALRIADRGYVLVGGRNFREGTGAALLADQEVQLTFLGGRREGGGEAQA